MDGTIRPFSFYKKASVLYDRAFLFFGFKIKYQNKTDIPQDTGRFLIQAM